MEHQEYNARRFIWANGLQAIGDEIVAAKTLLPWLFTSAGVPSFFAGLLVPVRESGSLLPQAALSPWVSSKPSRKKVWLIGSWGQAASAVGVAVCAATLRGVALGIGVIACLAALSIFRAICSISGKDVQGRTVEKGRRGLITGRATALAGAFTLAIGLAMMLLPGEPPRWIIVALLAFGASTWALASLVFAGVREPVAELGSAAASDEQEGWLKATWNLVSQDKQLRSFLIVRSMMLVTALSTPYIVILAQQNGANLSSLGAFIIASGGASLLGGRISGIWSDRSSKLTMALAAAFASTVIVVLLVCADVASPRVNAIAMPVGFFAINLAHTTIRVSRKTYLVDMADGERRTLITGASNTVMGIILLVVGALSSAAATVSTQAALIVLAALGAAGVVGAWNLKDVNKDVNKDV
ncbi:MFS transporter [Corynebacterium liangguodongii]|uniref:MFS transporter n=1 Tax=Corynebacterium liangguodongii TaxID=2079535 RepID=A0A2S0WDH4_9CORY|nr:MFS transporter [Corynebacterium liangguodongii]AWB83722.1 MFS transporter [Corynebacterium liangguodongii]PWB99468.1 MFS transporter [Corynebacterium liangguodongii]